MIASTSKPFSRCVNWTSLVASPCWTASAISPASAAVGRTTFAVLPQLAYPHGQHLRLRLSRHIRHGRHLRFRPSFPSDDQRNAQKRGRHRPRGAAIDPSLRAKSQMLSAYSPPAEAKPQSLSTQRPRAQAKPQSLSNQQPQTQAKPQLLSTRCPNERTPPTAKDAVHRRQIVVYGGMQTMPSLTTRLRGWMM